MISWRSCTQALKARLWYLFALWRFWVAAIVVAFCVWLFHLYAPAQHNPLRPLSLDHPVGLATYGKLTDLKYEPKTCFSALDAAAVPHMPVKDSETGRGCGFEDSLLTEGLLTPLGRELSMTCPLAATLYIWENTSARPLAEALLGSPLAHLETYGTYSCRNIDGSRRRSEHATANAIDIAAFRLADGRRISVLGHWGKDTPEGKYLERVHRAACGLFSVTLGPDYDAAHADHFHFDFGSGSTCR